MKFSSPAELLKKLRYKRYFGKGFVFFAGSLLVVWLLFFDSHSLVKRWTWHQESVRLMERNQALEQEILEIERQLGSKLPDELIEQLARERYGMRKEGETVYHVEKVQ